MAGILSGLKSLGLGDLEKRELYEEEEKVIPIRKAEPKRSVVEEKDLIYDKSFSCPVCDEKFTSKVMKTGRTRLVSTDLDSRPIYEGIDSNKYDVVEICNKIKLQPPVGETYQYEEVIPRYRVALACAIVKHGKDSEKAHICLHFAWLLRGYAQMLEEEGKLTAEDAKELKEQELECLKKALEGLVNARQKENLPICGMDQTSLDYIIAALAYELGKATIAAKMVSEILVSPVANSRIKDKARYLKQLILEEHKK